VHRTDALRLLAAVSGSISAYGAHGIELGLAVEEAATEPLRVTVRGDPEETTARSLRRVAVNSPRAWTLVLHEAPAAGGASEARVHGSREERVIRSPEELAAALGARGGS
jgi:hypothetical protein